MEGGQKATQMYDLRPPTPRYSRPVRERKRLSVHLGGRISCDGAPPKSRFCHLLPLSLCFLLSCHLLPATCYDLGGFLNVPYTPLRRSCILEEGGREADMATPISWYSTMID